MKRSACYLLPYPPHTKGGLSCLEGYLEVTNKVAVFDVVELV